jgi:hypothetical protein
MRTKCLPSERNSTLNGRMYFSRVCMDGNAQHRGLSPELCLSITWNKGCKHVRDLLCVCCSFALRDTILIEFSAFEEFLVWSEHRSVAKFAHPVETSTIFFITNMKRELAPRPVQTCTWGISLSLYLVRMTCPPFADKGGSLEWRITTKACWPGARFEKLVEVWRNCHHDCFIAPCTQCEHASHQQKPLLGLVFTVQQCLILDDRENWNVHTAGAFYLL